MKFSYAEEYFFPVVMKNIEQFDFLDDDKDLDLYRKKNYEELFEELFKEIDDEFINELLCK